MSLSFFLLFLLVVLPAVKVLECCWRMPPHHPQVIVKEICSLMFGPLAFHLWISSNQASCSWGARKSRTVAAGEFYESVSASVDMVSTSWPVLLSTAHDVWTKQPLLCETQVYKKKKSHKPAMAQCCHQLILMTSPGMCCAQRRSRWLISFAFPITPLKCLCCAAQLVPPCPPSHPPLLLD